ncbi:MAG: LVIVD repeat-containing protein [Dysgonomonas sp.]
MKKLTHLVCIIILCALYSCGDKLKEVTETYTYKVNEPVLMDVTEFRNSVKIFETPEKITKQGKICFYEGYLYISEPGKGIHIIDNRTPSEPKNVGFVEMIGNFDLAIREGLLYADSFVDLVWFDIQEPSKPELKGRLNDTFKNAYPPTDNPYGYDYVMSQAEGKIVVGWTLAERTATITYRPGEEIYCFDNASASKGNGTSGSMSRFGIYKDNLYVVMTPYMSVFNLSGETPVEIGQKIPLRQEVETIFSYKDNLFLGTPTGMLIYSVSNPLKPEYQSQITHIYGCDPVVVEDDMAYVTIRSGNFCGQNNNELFIVDVSDVKNPKQIASYAMSNPKGLGIDKGTLFLCDDGLKIFDAEDPQKIIANELAHYKGMDGYDVIPHNNTLMMIADDGLYQYDYSDLQDIKEISKMPINK